LLGEASAVREKEELRKLIKTGRQRERTELQPFVNDIPPHQPGQWTAKDQLAHVTAWRRVAAAELEAVRTGVPDPVVADGDDVENARIYEETHRLPAATVIEAAEGSWDQLSSALEACSEDVLSNPRIRDRGAEAWLWQVVPDNVHHLAEHLVYWQTEAGKDAGAEEAAKWAYEIATATLPDDRGRGAAEYNLGCFYAVRARLDEAMPYLMRGLELRPDLRDWAKQDSDLGLIRARADLVGELSLEK
jgi:tetratricopeptide (TPR) repeat protein